VEQKRCRLVQDATRVAMLEALRAFNDEADHAAVSRL